VARRYRSVLPFEGFRSEPVPRRCRHRRGCLSWGRLRFGVLICNRLVGLSVPHSRSALAVSGGAGGFYRLPSPAQLPRQVHPPVRFTPLQSTAVPNPPRASRRRAPSLGLAFPLRDVSLQRPCNGVPIPPPCRPRRFSRPRRFTPPPALWVYFTPQPRPGFPSRGFPSRTAVAPRRRPVALASVDDGSLPTVARQRHSPSPRPQGFDPCENPLPNLRCLAADPTRSPPGLPSSRSSLPTPCERLHARCRS